LSEANELADMLDEFIDDCLYAITVWVNNETSEVVFAVVRPQPGRSILSAAVAKRLLEKA
jgi:hypothetical protein